jgi:hypothetical protein
MYSVFQPNQVIFWHKDLDVNGLLHNVYIVS